MNYSIYRFTLDIHRTKSQVSIPVLFHDTGIQFYISLADGGKPYFIEDGCRAVFSAKKPDGATLFNDCIIEDNTRIRYDFTEQTTNCEGMMNCEIRLYGTDGNLLTTPAFVVVVDPRVIYDSEVLDSYPEATILDNMVSAENARLVGEQKRVDAEAVRVIVENARAAAEAERIAAENARAAAEVVRGDAETERIANEAERVAAFAHMIGSWVAYSAYEDGTDYTWTWSEGQRYIGICNGKTPPQDKTGFVWSKFVDTGIYVGSGDMPSWCDLQIDPDGDVTEIVQTPGQSTTNVMSQKAVSDNFANALKGSANGEIVMLDDVSPIEHDIYVKVKKRYGFDWGFSLLDIIQAVGQKIIYKDGWDLVSHTGLTTWSKGIPIDVFARESTSATVKKGGILSTGYVGSIWNDNRDKNVAYGCAGTPSSGTFPYKWGVFIDRDASGGWRYTVEHTGSLTLSIDTIRSRHYHDGSYGYVAVFHNGQMIWPMKGDYYGTLEKWAEIDRYNIAIDANAIAELKVVDNSTKNGSLENIAVNEGDEIEILVRHKNATDKFWNTGPDGSNRCGFECTARVECTVPANVFQYGANLKEPIIYPASADGGARVTSIYPNTTLTTDTAGAIMDVTYNRDANKVVNELATRIAALEAAALN